MSLELENICRLCLKTTQNNFVVIEIIKQLSDILLLKLDLDIIEDPIICKDCVEAAKKCLSFKSTCIATEIKLLTAGKKQSKHTIKVIYKQGQHVRTVVEKLDVCRFCLTQLEENNSVSLNMLMNWTMFKMLIKCIPEMDINFIEDPIICTSCRDHLENYFKFLLKCLDMETKMKSYCRKGTNNTNQLNLHNTLNLLCEDILKYPTKSPQICGIEEKSVILEAGKAYGGLIKLEEELDIKEENSLEESSDKYLPGKGLDQCGDSLLPKQKGTKLEITSLKTETGNIQRCDYQKNIQANDTKEISIHENVSRKKMLKCPLCNYTAKYKSNLKMHVLVHKDISEIEMHKCSLCDHKTKYKGHIKKHMLVHKDISEIEMYECSLCSYEAKRKYTLKKHMLVHKDVSEIKMYKCSKCSCEVKRKASLKRHMLVHKKVSEIEMHKCILCDYETKRKRDLYKHITVTHKNISETKMDKCSFEGNQKSYLKTQIKRAFITKF